MKLVLILCAFFISVHAIRKPVWGPRYTVEGVLRIPYNKFKVEDDFKAWFDEDEERSRVDYNRHTVKTYQFGQLGSRELIKIYPSGDGSGETTLDCMKSSVIQENILQPALPIIDDRFEPIARRKQIGMNCIKWGKTEKGLIRRFFNGKNRTEEVTVKETFQVCQGADGEFIPISYGKLIKTNSMTLQQFVIEYHSYKSEIDDIDSIFVPDPDLMMKCISLPQNDIMIDLLGYYIPAIPSDLQKHTNFMHNFNVSYDSFNEHVYRHKIFMDNVRFIEATNQQNLSYTLAVNQFADRSPDELKQMGCLKSSRASNDDNDSDIILYGATGDINLPDSFDWRDKGAVTPIKNQLDCGACWAFATAASVEGAWFKKSGKLVNLSQQSIIDCTWKYGNGGCLGGTPSQAMEWIRDNHGIPTDMSYHEYEQLEGVCDMKYVKKVAPITKIRQVEKNSGTAMKEALYKYGPITACLDASSDEFKMYSGGTLYAPKRINGELKLNHAVVVVGWGMNEKGKEHWIVKNSWGTSWGIDGYAHILIENDMGILQRAFYTTFE